MSQSRARPRLTSAWLRRGSAGSTTAVRAIGLLGEVVLTLGLLMVLFVIWQVWWTDIGADRDQRQSVAEVQERWAHAPAPNAAPTPTLNVRAGAVFATVRIPRFGADYVRPIIEGTDRESLMRGVGHLPGSAWPGQLGNFATAGHRVTYGKPYERLDELQPGDEVIVEVAQGQYMYRVTGAVVVRPEQREVLSPNPSRPGRRADRAIMTLIACHPKFTARERYVTYAAFDRFVPRPKLAAANLGVRAA